MPSINEVLERVSRVRPDAIDDETKAAWLLALDGQLFRDVILRHRVHPGPRRIGPTGVCPVCGGYGLDEDGKPRDPEGDEEPVPPAYHCALDYSSCGLCGWTELPKYPRKFPEDGDMALLVPAPHDELYDQYIMTRIDFINREIDNYNNSTAAYLSSLDEWRREYHRTHAPVGPCGFRNLV